MIVDQNLTFLFVLNRDSNEYLNTSSYVNVVFEPEEMEVAQIGWFLSFSSLFKGYPFLTLT